MSEPSCVKSDYDFLSSEQWEKVCDLLNRDALAEKGAFVICAPSHPENGQEPGVFHALETEHMVWLTTCNSAPLSEFLLLSANFDELHEMVDGVRNTVRVLEDALADLMGRAQRA